MKKEEQVYHLAKMMNFYFLTELICLKPDEYNTLLKEVGLISFDISTLSKLLYEGDSNSMKKLHNHFSKIENYEILELLEPLVKNEGVVI